MLNGKRLQGAGDYTSRLLIVEVSSNNWKNDRMPAKFADLIGVKAKLQILESECVWDYVVQFPATRNCIGRLFVKQYLRGERVQRPQRSSRV